MDIDELISKLTLEEKASLCSGIDMWRTKPIEKISLPSITMTDGPHGVRKQDSEKEKQGIFTSAPATCFPTASLTACSFDRELLEAEGGAIAEECIKEDIQILLGPGTNIKRSPLCGRNFEYFSEDPFLSSSLSSSFIKGVQNRGVGCCLKHFAVNNQENRRLSVDAKVDERTLHEIYLASFEDAIKASKPVSVMCSYNKVNGTYASENPYLLTEILRKKWGFNGIVISDWGAVNDRAKGIDAGLNLEMPSSMGVNDKEIVKAVKNGTLSEKALDKMVYELIETIFKLYNDKKHIDNPSLFHDNHELARKAARESIVLLKNEGVLPLNPNDKICFIGEFAEKPRFQGGGSSNINPISIDTVMNEVSKICNVDYSKGFSSTEDILDEDLFKEAILKSKDSDVCVIFAGLPNSFESEGYDRSHMRLPDAQNKLIDEILKVQKNVVIVLQNGSPIEMPWIDSTRGILEAYLGGEASGSAIVDILFGKQNPCGKLAETFPKKLSHNPSYLYYDGEKDDAVYGEGIFVGYRYYDKKDLEVLFPFGHGLSYTNFEYSNMKLDKDKIFEDETLKVTVDIKNTGDFPGKEIAQLYIGKKEKGFAIRPIMELKGFEKVFLDKGETKTITFLLNKRSFSYYNTKLNDFHIESGDYIIYIGKSSRNIILKEEVYVESKVKIDYAITINTAFKDILEVKGGEEFLSSLTKDMPIFNTDIKESPLTDMFRGMYKEMTLRSVGMFMYPRMNNDELQKKIDDFFYK